MKTLIFWGLLKNPNFRGGFMKSQYTGGLPKKGGTWSVCRFKGGGLGKKGGVMFLSGGGGLILWWTPSI